MDLYHFTEPITAQELIAFCKDKRYCPYFLSKRLLKEISVIVCNFQWLFNPDIRYRFLKLLDTSLKNCILVVDECHNIIDVATEVNSDKLIPYFLTSCIKDLQTHRLPEKYWKLLGVSGGRNSEGEDYPGGFMNSVIIVGIPYHLPSPRVEAKIKYYNKQFNRQGWNFAYLYPAMQRANQASGRPIRRKIDKGLIIFMDERSIEFK